MQLRLKKKSETETVFTCVRADGTWTGASLGRAKGYFPAHDLAHYVVETSLGLTGAFLGLLDRGWDVADFEVGAVTRSRTESDGAQAVLAEHLAGALPTEVFSGNRIPADEWNRVLQEACAGFPGGTEVPVCSDEELDGLRAELRRLLDRWERVPYGETLELQFPFPAPRSS